MKGRVINKTRDNLYDLLKKHRDYDWDYWDIALECDILAIYDKQKAENDALREERDLLLGLDMTEKVDLEEKIHEFETENRSLKAENVKLKRLLEKIFDTHPKDRDKFPSGDALKDLRFDFWHLHQKLSDEIQSTLKD